MKRTAFAVLALAGISLGLATATTVTFENPALASDSYSDSSSFTDSGATFSNTYTDFGGGFFGWSGFARSNTTDTTTAGFGNQYSSFAGGGSGSATYGVGYVSGFDPVPAISFGGLVSVGTIDLTNTTYAALSMQQGDFFAKKFGGDEGTDPDYLLLTISGYAGGSLMGTVDFYLANFQFADSGDDYIVNSWTSVDLSSLGPVDQLKFTMSSSDVGESGINTPTYFAVDNIQFVPEPSAFLLASIGLVPLLRRKRVH